MIEEELLRRLVCPVGKSELHCEADYLVCSSCGLKFPIREGIPVMLIEDAELPEGAKSIEELSCGSKKAEGV